MADKWWIGNADNDPLNPTVITPEIWNLLVQAHNYGILHAMDRVSSGEISHTFTQFIDAYNLKVDWNK